MASNSKHSDYLRETEGLGKRNAYDSYLARYASYLAGYDSYLAGYDSYLAEVEKYFRGRAGGSR